MAESQEVKTPVFLGDEHSSPISKDAVLDLLAILAVAAIAALIIFVITPLLHPEYYARSLMR
jgi:hypothetical protein